MKTLALECFRTARRRAQLFKVCGAISLVICPLSSAFGASLEGCAPDVGRLFSAYLVDVNKSNGNFAQYYSQKFLAWDANSLLSNSGDSSAAIALLRNRLTTGRGSVLVNSTIVCKRAKCSLRANMKHANRSDSFVLTYASASGSCSDLKIDQIEFIEKLESKAAHLEHGSTAWDH